MKASSEKVSKRTSSKKKEKLPKEEDGKELEKAEDKKKEADIPLNQAKKRDMPDEESDKESAGNTKAKTKIKSATKGKRGRPPKKAAAKDEGVRKMSGVEEKSAEKEEDGEEGEEEPKKPKTEKKSLKKKEEDEAKPMEDKKVEEDSSKKDKEKVKEPSKKKKIKKGATASQVTPLTKKLNEDEEEEESGEKASSTGKPKKAKKTTKKKSAFKKGKFNPAIKLITEEVERESKSEELFDKCCVGCTNRNSIRAAITNNEKLVKNCISSKRKMSSLFDTWSCEMPQNSFYYAIKYGHPEILHELIKANNSVSFICGRYPAYLISYLNTGMVCEQAYGVRVRKVQMARGNRQGNNAFLEKSQNTNMACNMYEPSSLFHLPNITFELLQKLILFDQNNESTINQNINQVILTGNNKLAAELINRIKGMTNYGFNNLHYDVLRLKDEDLPEFHRASLHKKATGNDQVTPTHCACINPNPKYIKAILDTDPNIHLMDGMNRKPIHYAAACSSPEPLKVLLEFGASLADLDNEKRNPLHYAAMSGRAENIKLLVGKNPLLLKGKDRNNMFPFHYACERGHLEAVKAFVEFKINVNQGGGIARMSGLAFAAANNHYELCEFLLSNKGKVTTKDKFKRNPLILAVRNGNAKVASLLLQRGAPWDEADSSGNTPLLYAAAYGWMQCVDLLLSAGADINAYNSWKITPLNIAMLKNHYGMVKHLLNKENVDVNCKDERGRTLLSLAAELTSDEALDYIEFLLRDKKADPNIADLDGLTPLHYLVQKTPPIDNYIQELNRFSTQEEQKLRREEFIKFRKAMIELFLKYGANVNCVTKAGKNLFDLCLDSHNYDLLELFADTASFASQPQLMFAFASLIYNPKIRKTFDKIMENSKPSKEGVNTMDSFGFTIFLKFLKEFETSAAMYYNNIVAYITKEMKRLKYIGEVRFSPEYMNLSYEKYMENINQDNFAAFNPQEREIQSYFLPPSDYLLINKYAAKEFIKSFVMVLVETLQRLIIIGANPKAKVGKLQKFRDPKPEDKFMTPQLNTNSLKNNFAQLPGIMQNIVAQIPGGFGGINNFNQPQQLKPKKEEEYSEDGLCNAWHFALMKPIRELLDFLFSLDIPLDEGNFRGDTPFMWVVGSHNLPPFMLFDDVYNELKKKKVDIDKPNIQGVTPFLRLISNGMYDRAMQLAADKANVNANDVKNNFALKYLVNANNVAITKKLLVEYHADPNKIDFFKRTVLHYAINNSNPTIDSTNDMENLLLDSGADVNALDCRGRSPLHYAFVKIGKWKENSVIDPIEVVTTLCSKINIEVNLPDNWGKSPLHYAAQRSSTISSLFLLNRGADLEAKDKYGNTPLGVAFLNSHPDYAITLIEKDADVTQMVNPENPSKLKPSEGKEEKKKKRRKAKAFKGSKLSESEGEGEGEDENSEAMPDGTKKEDDEDGEINEDEDSEEPSMNKAEKSQAYPTAYPQMPNLSGLSRQQRREAMRNYRMERQRARQFQPNPYLNQKMGFQQPAQLQQSTRTVTDNPLSMFRIAIRMGWQGLLYLLLDKKYDYMLGMQDALSEGKYQLLLNLLRKTAQDTVVQKYNDKHQNLMHVLAMYGSGASYQQLEEIYNQFVKRGVEHMAIDIYGRSALHYAVEHQNIRMINVLLHSKYDPNIVDKKGDNALSLLVRGEGIASAGSTISDLLIAGANLNYMYRETFYIPRNNITAEELKVLKESCEYKTTPVIHLVRYIVEKNRTKDTRLQALLLSFLQKGADLTIADTDGRDCFMYIALANCNEILDYVLKNTIRINYKQVDKYGKTAFHYAVKQYEFGSFQNVDLIEMLLNAKFVPTIKDKDGLSAVDLAGKMTKLANIFSQVGLKPEREIKSIWPGPPKLISHWPLSIDFNFDADKYMSMAEQAMEKILEDEKVPVDRVGNQNEPLEVVYDESSDKDKPEAYDVYMNKVDLKNGIYGEYLFYRMQILRNTNRDVFMLYTRWGRIGEDGMFQKTPFGNKEECVTEFEKIFKSKSGNDWSERHNFQKVPNKYVLMQLQYKKLHYQQVLKPFNLKNPPIKSQIPKVLQRLMKMIVDVAMYEKAMSHFGINLEQLPVTKLKKSALEQAKKILDDMGALTKKLEEERAKGMKADAKLLEECYNDIMDLSSRYYEFLPQANYLYTKPRPIDNSNEILRQMGIIDDLINIEAASKILLGAKLREPEINPLDYCYRSIEADLSLVPQNSQEFEIISTYINRSANSSSAGTFYGTGTVRIKNIFRIQRKGEYERFEPFTNMSNRWLLYHGSKTSNFIGILNQGLRVAPPNVAITGWAFGKGMYFADTFMKSASYCYTYSGNEESADLLMLICEAALGRMANAGKATFAGDDAPKGYNSVLAKGTHGPNMNKRLYLDDGSEVPMAEIIENKEDKFNTMLAHNEYIVFKPEQVKMRYLIQWSNKAADIHDDDD